MKKKEQIGLIITAAGYGVRMNSDKPKMLLEINNKPVLHWSVIPFLEIDIITKIIITYPDGYFNKFKNICDSLFQSKQNYELVQGGNTRQNSIKKAIAKMNNVKWIGVHDGCRPLIEPFFIKRLINKVKQSNACIPALPIRDTVKKVQSNKIVETLQRDTLFLVQTPQFFEYNLLLRAYQHAESINYIGTDDASLVEQLGEPVFFIKGEDKNIKLTVPADMLIASMYLR